MLAGKGREKIELESALHKAIERNELVLHYQPKVHLASGAIAGAEALVTGDRRHFGHLMGKRVRGLWVVSLAEALAGVMGLLEDKG